MKNFYIEKLKQCNSFYALKNFLDHEWWHWENTLKQGTDPETMVWYPLDVSEVEAYTDKTRLIAKWQLDRIHSLTKDLLPSEYLILNNPTTNQWFCLTEIDTTDLMKAKSFLLYVMHNSMNNQQEQTRGV